MKVSVIKVVDFYKTMELPMPDDEFPTLLNAVKGFIQWPISAIAHFKGLTKTPVSREPTKNVLPQHQKVPAVEKRKGIETAQEPTNKKKALEEKTNHKMAKTKIAEQLTAKERDEKRKASAHYVLFIICPGHRRGFILDSSKASAFCSNDEYMLAGLVDSVLGSSLKWELPIVNRQPGTWESGYYVMKWMQDFVLKYQNDNFPNIIPWGEERRLENRELDAVIEAFINKALFLVSNSQHEVLNLQYKVCYARILDLKRKFLEAALCYYNISQIEKRQIGDEVIDEDALEQAWSCNRNLMKLLLEP
ncbi:COP8-like protein [Artemisia annua]|uniref:COP8-like protein n=1 Tax=Artemisia annua TaxID=35608 RepID=A0A2U1LHC9_ARTAN|nr:COP8-like protein [Artemisia annua]